MKKTPKFEISQLLTIGMTLVVLGIALAYGLQVMGDVIDDVASCETGYTYNDTANNCYETANASHTVATGNIAFNASNDAMTGIAKIPNKLPTIATIIVAAVIIGILVRYLWVR